MNSMNPMQGMTEMARPTPEKPISRSCTRLGNTVTDLDAALDNLFQAIDPALGPNLPEPGDPGGEKRGTMETSEVARYLDNESDRLATLVAMVRRITDRVEL